MESTPTGFDYAAFLQHSYNANKIHGGIYRYEHIWLEHQPVLAERGYVLRPRYRPGWVPSWLGTDQLWFCLEDGQALGFHCIMDAIRVADNRHVAIKLVDADLFPYEVEITKHFSVDPLASDPRNHSVPVYDVFPSPLYERFTCVVMPYLVPVGTIRFATVGEVVGCFDQLFEGLQLIHHEQVAHRDIGTLNIMMDPSGLFSETPHPCELNRSYDFRRKVRRHTRTQRPPKYYFIDFGLSRKYSPNNTAPRELPVFGGDKTVPEYKRDYDRLWNPFPADIYYLGNMIREDFLQRCHGLEFMDSLIRDMVQDDPDLRPTIDEARTRYLEIRASLSTWKLRSRLVYRKDWAFVGFFRAWRHVIRTAEYAVMRKPAIPVLSMSG